MFTVVDQIANPDNISATDVAYGDSSVAEAIAKKQDAETGKGLSSNDYTNDDKAKLAALPTNTALQSALDGKQAAGNYVMNGSGTMPGGQTFVGGAAVGYFRESNVNKGIIISGSAASALSETAPLEYLRFNRSTKRIEHQIYDGTNWSTVMTFTADEDTGWQTLASGVYYRKKNGMVAISMSNNSQAQTATETAVATLPEGCRPSRQIIAVGVTNQFAQYLGISVNTNGEIRTRTATGTGTGFYGSVSFPV